MKILHYFLGFPPYRSGGMTKFAFDLMKKQVYDQNQVIALWPGSIIKIGGEPRVKKRKDIFGIKNYELVNPLPISLDEGISEFDIYTSKCDEEIYFEFLKLISPDVIHIHTLMGLHKEFISVSNDLGIRLVYTTHDFFGICPKVTLFKNGNVCTDDNGCRDCIGCNLNALSLNKIKILQSPIYRLLKDNKYVTKARIRHRNRFHEQKISFNSNSPENELISNKYKSLREYYLEMIESMDFLHFNSSVTKNIYLKYVEPKDYDVISITHSNISNNKIKKYNDYDLGKKKIYTFLSPTKSYKGYNTLKKALDEIWMTNKNFELRLYSPVEEISSYMKVTESGFSYSDLKKIMEDSDILFAPSNAYETFGFTILEALSFGVPVIISDNVGSKDIIGNAGVIFPAGDHIALKEQILKLDSKKLKLLSKNAFEIKVKLWDEFVNEIYDVYKKNNTIIFNRGNSK